MTPQMGYYAKVSDEPPGYMVTPMLKCITPCGAHLTEGLVVKKRYI